MLRGLGCNQIRGNALQPRLPHHSLHPFSIHLLFISAKSVPCSLASYLLHWANLWERVRSEIRVSLNWGVERNVKMQAHGGGLEGVCNDSAMRATASPSMQRCPEGRGPSMAKT